MLIYDCEIIKAIPSKREPKVEGIEYCDGWTDYANMGVSVIGVYDYVTGKMGVFLEDNFSHFVKLMEARDVLVGFNSKRFDNRLLAENTIYIPDEKCYDLLEEIWKSAKLNPDKFNFQTHGGYGLDATAKVNIGSAKIGYGGSIPIDWQQGKIGKVINYCLNDVWLTKLILDAVIKRGEIINPKFGRASIKNAPGNLKIRKPQQSKQQSKQNGVNKDAQPG